jgi:gluconokinase
MGWRDDRSDALVERTREYGLTVTPQTFCELFDADEGRPLGGTRSWEPPAIGAIIVMGVSGCGKSTVGRALAALLRWDYLEGDDLHPPANVAKMSAGIPLDDADRGPWLEAIARAIADTLGRGGHVVVACSALKHAYRETLAPDPGPVRFVYLRGRFEVLRQRMETRSGHFMKEAMLKSQLETLEEPVSALTLDIETAPAVLAERIRQVLVPA